MIQPIRRIGNSQGILIPRNILQACGIEEQVEMTLVGRTIVLRPVKKQPREGWEEQFQTAKASGDTPDSDLFEGMANDFDSTDWKW